MFPLVLLVCFAALSARLGYSLLLSSICRRDTRRRRAVLEGLGIDERKDGKRTLIGFFHPYCNAGGGGERVLWTAIAYHQSVSPEAICAIYSGDVEASKDEILEKAEARFGIHLSKTTIVFIPVRSRYLVEDHYWKRFTLLGQSLGSMRMAWDALVGDEGVLPDVFIDTMGYAFTFPVVRALAPSAPICAYVHYPTISTDMLERVRQRQSGHTNDSAVTSSAWRSVIKLQYYRLFAAVYAQCLAQADSVMVNSSWTKNHVDTLLARTPFPLLSAARRRKEEGRGEASIVYPPCDVKSLVDFPLHDRSRNVVSLAQFRPEKDHPAQLHMLCDLLQAHPELRSPGGDGIELVLIGSSRNEGDARRVEQLKALAGELGIEDSVRFVVNAPYSEVLKELSKASVGVSTMVDEHFGINVVEFMAAGLVPLVHASGGPLHDIVVPLDGEATGFHAITGTKSGQTSTEYPTFSEALWEIISLPLSGQLAMRERARRAAERNFSEEQFRRGWAQGVGSLVGRLATVSKDTSSAR